MLLSTLVVNAGASFDDGGDAEGNAPPYLAVRVTRLPSSVLTAFLQPAEMTASEQQLSVGLQRFRFENASIDLGIDYQYTRFEYAGAGTRNRDLHRLQVPIRFNWRPGPWRYRGYLAPGVSTSSNVFKDFLNRGSQEDLHLSGRFEAQRGRISSHWFVGAAFDQSFGRSRLYPVVGAEFPVTDRLHLRIAFPDPGASFAATGRQSIIARLFPAGHSWHVVADDFNSDFEYRAQALRSQLTWSILLTNAFAIDISGGYEFRRHHRFTDDRGERIRTDINDQWLFAIGFRFGSSPLPYANGSGF